VVHGQGDIPIYALPGMVEPQGEGRPEKKYRRRAHGQCGASAPAAHEREQTLMTSTPLHVGTVAAHRLRFFRSPLNDARPDFPWHSVEDLYACLNVDQQARKFFFARLRQEYGSVLRTVATADELVTIAPNFMAQGLIDAMIEKGQAPQTAAIDYQFPPSAPLRSSRRWSLATALCSGR
jgi:hypothetical protein